MSKSLSTKYLIDLVFIKLSYLFWTVNNFRPYITFWQSFTIQYSGVWKSFFCYFSAWHPVISNIVQKLFQYERKSLKGNLFSHFLSSSLFPPFSYRGNKIYCIGMQRLQLILISTTKNAMEYWVEIVLDLAGI